MGLPSDYVETRRKWGCRPEGRGADIKLRKLQEGDGGHAAAQRHKEARRHTHERAREHSLHTRPQRTRPLEGIAGRSHSSGLAVPPAAPLQRLAQQAAAPARPVQPSPGWVQRGASPGKGCVPPAAQGAEGRGGARPWGRGPGAYKIALRPDINKSCLPGHPLPRLIARSLILASLFTSRWAPRRQPCWHLSVLAH